ncbi:phosphodiesterase, MJ0936 family [Pyrolobus fumarii 1A]|uniref:Phosphoesterase n=1 Tax=Pyrolobus fumarii (strain DSM 11204 / 1A) TaxID=694429 RepID=G0EDZ8_PYRF1|nr:metallophosphoesterase [Pyrolobus fumarii]AEM37914.1 phosphodiesterase, MJ0936 family [Pyrolobus fumarii 1A]
MLIGVMSDSHDYIRGVRLAAKLFKEHGVELVVHLGDVVAPFTLRALREQGVRDAIIIYGNNDGERRLLERVAASLGYRIYEPPRIEVLGGVRIAMLHGWGSEEETLSVVEALAESGAVDVVLYGHTHKSRVEKRGAKIVLNPGETCGCLTGRMSVAILDTKTREASIHELGLREDHL